MSRRVHRLPMTSPAMLVAVAVAVSMCAVAESAAGVRMLGDADGRAALLGGVSARLQFAERTRQSIRPTNHTARCSMRAGDAGVSRPTAAAMAGCGDDAGLFVGPVDRIRTDGSYVSASPDVSRIHFIALPPPVC